MKIVRPFFHTSMPLSCAQKERERQENGLAPRTAWPGAPADVCTCTLLPSDARVCLLSNSWNKHMQTESKDPDEELATGKPQTAGIK